MSQEDEVLKIDDDQPMMVETAPEEKKAVEKNEPESVAERDSADEDQP